MKKYLFLIAMMAVVFVTAVAQSKVVEDDIYFKPSDAVKQSQRKVNTQKPVYKNGAKEIVFIERGQQVEIATPDTTVLLGQANDSTEEQTDEGYYMNGFNGSKSDLEYASRIRKFHNPKYRVFIGDPAYNDIYFLNNFDWNVYVEDNYAYVTPTWTNPYWFDYSFSPYSFWGWNSWSYGYPSYSNFYGWGNYPWSYNNYWGGGFGSYYGGYYGNYWGGGYYGYGMGYPYYGYGGYNQGFYDGYYYGNNYTNAGYLNNRSKGTGTREPNNLRTTIGGGGTIRNASSVRTDQRLNQNYTAVGSSNRSVVNANGARSIRSDADFQQGRATSTSSTNRAISERNGTTFNNINTRASGLRNNDTNYRNASANLNARTTRESSINAGSTLPRVSTTPRTASTVQPNQNNRSNYSSSTNSRSTYSTGTPAVSRESRSSYSTSSSNSSRSSYNSSSSSSSGTTYRSAPSTSSSSSYSSGSSSSYSSGGSSRSSSSGNSRGGRR